MGSPDLQLLPAPELLPPLPPITLPYLFCFIIDLNITDGNSTCFKEEGREGEVCVRCREMAKFHTGGEIENYSTGQKVCIFIWVLTLFFGILSIVSNCAIIHVFRRQPKVKAFEVLLGVLALFDLMCGVMSVFASSGFVAFFGNWGRSLGSLKWVHVTYYLLTTARSGSTLMKVAITVERYIFISRPDKLHVWLGKAKAFLLCIILTLVSIALNVPRYFFIQIVPNRWPEHLFSPRIDHLMVHSKWMSKPWFPIFKEILEIVDFWGPIPFLIVFCLLILREVRKINCEKRELQICRYKDIRETTGFLPVILILFLFNLLPLVHYTIMEHMGYVYREQVLGMFLLLTICAFLNFPIYCWKSSVFRKEVKNFMLYFSRYE